MQIESGVLYPFPDQGKINTFDTLDLGFQWKELKQRVANNEQQHQLNPVDHCKAAYI